MSKKTIICLGVLLIIGVFIGGITLGFSGVFYFTTKYYETPTKAFMSEYSAGIEGSIEIQKPVDTIIIDENNCMFLAITEDKKLLVAEMVIKNGKYAYSGTYYRYDFDSESDYKKDTGLIMTQTDLYNSKGKVVSSFKWCIVLKDEVSSEVYKELYYKEYLPDDYKSFIFIADTIYKPQ